jgi:hypothetical protein
MTIQINSNYLEKYAHDYAAVVCENFFSSRQFITGQDIIQLTDSAQVNFFVIKRIFENWQDELQKLKGSPYFDYRDIAVHEALTQFMNVLSKRIKVEKSNLEPLVAQAVAEAIQLAVDPVGFYQNEIQKAPHGMINEFLSEHKKYFKWHLPVISFLIDKTGFGHDQNAYLKAVATNYHVIKDSLVSKNLLLATLGEINAFDLDSYLIEEELEVPKAEIQKSEPDPGSEKEQANSFFDEVEENSDRTDEPNSKIISKPIVKEASQKTSSGMLDAISLQTRFEKESYKGMKGVIGELSESLAINQRIMFSKALFEGNSDLLKHALKLIDESGSFANAVDMMNNRYVNELSWNDNPDVMDEFILLVFRKYST